MDKRYLSELDDFWDISSLVPKKRSITKHEKSVSTVEIRSGAETPTSSQNKLSEPDTLIKVFIPQRGEAAAKEEERVAESYVPESSLVHKVTLLRSKSEYSFYESFCRTGERLWSKSAEKSDYVEFFSYSPQYDQLNQQQLAYYLWWRGELREGRFPRTNLCYLNLYMFELINVSGGLSPWQTRERMLDAIEGYSSLIKGCASRYVRWVCDYSLVHRLPPPSRMTLELVRDSATLKEYFVRVPNNNSTGWARALLEYCSSYDYKSSKFAKDDALELFNVHVLGAMACVVEALSSGERILSKLPFSDCRISLRTFEGAVCSAANRYTAEVEYCSFSRSHELRFLVGDAVKYAENKIRAYLSVKSRLTVYSLPKELEEVIDAYFETALPVHRRQIKRGAPVEEYEAMYDIPRKPIDASAAAKIEQESWQITKELVLEEEQDIPAVSSWTAPTAAERELALGESGSSERSIDTEAVMDHGELSEDGEEGSLRRALGGYLKCVKALANEDRSAIIALAAEKKRALDAMVDDINAIAVEAIGDIIIDDGLCVVEDYLDML